MFKNAPSKEMDAMLEKATSSDKAVAIAAQRFIAKAALEVPLRDGIVSGDILDGIFTPGDFSRGQPVIYPLSFFAPGAEREHVAYAIPLQGRIPERYVEGSEVQVPTYPIGSSINTLIRYVEFARWDVVGRMAEVLEAGFVKKMNDDGWHTLLAAGVDRNINVFDGDAANGQFTKRLVAMGKTVMARNGGGNSTSLVKSKLTHMYTSLEAIEDIRGWNLDQVDDQTRREIYVSADGGLGNIFGVEIRNLYELGVGQEYQLFFTNDLGGSMASGDEEIVLGLDLATRNSFMMPVRKQVEIFEDEGMHRSQQIGWYGWTHLGFAVMDNRGVIVLSF